MYTSAAVFHAGKTACAKLDMLVNYMNEIDLVFVNIIHTIQKSAGKVHCIALISFRTSVKAAPHNYCRAIAQSDFSADCTN